MSKTSLFVNLTSDEGWRAAKALRFSTQALMRGHAVTILLNIRAVFVADITKKGFDDERDLIRGVIEKGGRILIGPDCMNEAGMPAENVMKGVETATADSVFEAAMAEDAKIISW
ncbi:hypothetical protein [Limisalsivibrio acetivorans]|uniref:hypothetical protein n=1 Tax=Limisalsivibrio acetivorans TaxID=1304888 RepID=UPI0003B7515E|nr:hypothetical protein [Limisalsivibrio acetivorans]